MYGRRIAETSKIVSESGLPAGNERRRKQKNYRFAVNPGSVDPRAAAVMSIASPATRFRDLRRPVAVAVLATTALLIAALLPLAMGYQPPPPAHPGNGDLALYGRIVERLHAGGSYYAVAHAELLAGHYATLSVLNWRTPFYPWLLSLFPSVGAAQAALCLLALVAAGAAYALLWRRTNAVVTAAFAPVLLVSLGGCLVSSTVLYSEYAAGMLILLSASAFGLGYRRTGFGAAIAALFIRELALPYVVVCLALAIREKRHRETAAWLVALALYAGYFAWHSAMVHAQLGPADFSYPNGGWLRFGGAAFVLSTAGFNGLFAGMPLWVSAVLLPLGVLGLLAWPGTADSRIALTTSAYLLAFAFVGRPVNEYWGAMYTPLLTLGLPWAALAIADLLRAVASGGVSAASPRPAR